MSDYRLHEPLPQLDAPVFVCALTGWIDASAAAASALAEIESACAVRTVATFDGDVFIDYRARRPTMELRDGVSTRLVWPEIELKVGTDRAGRDVVVLSGPEPDSAWRRFADAVASLAADLSVRTAVFLGAYPFAAPHSRPPRISCTSASPEIIAAVPFLRSSVDVPAGMSAVLEHAFTARRIPALGIWAQVPHYVSAMTYPAATAALIDALDQYTGLVIGSSGLKADAAIQRQRIDQLVGGNAEHLEMVRRLEALYDDGSQERDDGQTQIALSQIPPESLPSADEIAAEFERFLREQES